MQLTPQGRRSLWIAAAIFITSCFIAIDTYNTLNHRTFPGLMLQGNPFTLAKDTFLEAYGKRWALDWPYPPLTLLVLYPAWLAYYLTGSEIVYQFMYKLPIFAAALVCQLAILRLTSGRQNTLSFRRLADHFMLIPIIVLSYVGGGAFDVLTAMFVICAYYLFTKERYLLAIFLIGCAGALRFYPLALIPIFGIHLYKNGIRRPGYLALFGLVSLAPLILSFLPFLIDDPQSLISVLLKGNQSYGQTSSLSVAGPVLVRVMRIFGYQFNYNVYAYALTVATLIGVLVVYMAAMARPSTLLSNCLLLLIVVFLFYPKVQCVYLISFLPLAVVQENRFASWAWAPGFLWAMTVNGAFGATGPFYLLAPTTGFWYTPFSPQVMKGITILAVVAQIILLVAALVELRRRPLRQPTLIAPDPSASNS